MKSPVTDTSVQGVPVLHSLKRKNLQLQTVRSDTGTGKKVNLSLNLTSKTYVCSQAILCLRLYILHRHLSGNSERGTAADL